MAAISRAHNGASVVGLERVPRERISRYGIVAGTPEDDRVLKLTDLVEKPQPENAPSDLAIAGRYLLHPDIFALLASQTPGHGGEIQLTDSIRRLLAARPVYGAACSPRAPSTVTAIRAADTTSATRRVISRRSRRSLRRPSSRRIRRQPAA